jgi:aminomethyltransferase
LSTDGALKRTPLFDLYRGYGGRVIPFGGWEMPVQFSGIIAEHQAVRTRAGLFDASHMGEIWVEGPDALAAVQHLTVNDAAMLSPGRVQYSAMANYEGGLVDDITVFAHASDRFMLCVNAANIDKDLRWIKAHMDRFPRARVVDQSADTALLAVQGPRSQSILGRLTYADLEKVPYYRFITAKMAGIEVVISRTGYTGEDGFELFLEAGKARDMWEEIMAMGESAGLRPCGLGARDTLRLEMGYALYGQDIDDTTSPLEAGLGWITKLDKGDFAGREAMLRQRDEGAGTRLAAFVCQDRGVPRRDCPILHQGRPVGRVTSGTMSPSLKVGIGLGYVPAALAVAGVELAVAVRDRVIKALAVAAPFYHAGSSRKKSSIKKED